MRTNGHNTSTFELNTRSKQCEEGGFLLMRLCVSAIVDKILTLEKSFTGEDKHSLAREIEFLVLKEIESQKIPYKSGVGPDRSIPGRLVDSIYEQVLERRDKHLEESSHQARVRKRIGSYITPWRLAQRVAEYGLQALGETELHRARVVDLGVGTGVFLSAILSLLEERGKPDAIWVKSLYALDRDPLALALTRVALHLEKGEAPPRENFFLGDLLLDPEVFLSLGQRGPYDLILTNPPYERLSKLDGAKKEEKELAKEYAERVKKQGGFSLATKGPLDTYKLFLERAIDLLRPGGVLSALIPAGFLGDQSAKELREHFLRNRWIYLADLYSEATHPFPGISQGILLLVVRKEFSHRHIYIAQKGRPLSQIPYDRLERISRDGLRLALISEEEVDLLTHLQKHPTLSQIPSISVHRGELDMTKHRKFIGKDGLPLYQGKHIRPFHLEGGERCPIEFLGNASKKKLEHIHSMRLAGRQVANQKSRRRLVFAAVEPPAVLANSINYLLVADESPYNFWFLLALLNSRLLDWYFRIWNANNHIGIYELKKLPIPAEAPQKTVKELAEIARTVWLTPQSLELWKQRIEELVLEAYGLRTHSIPRKLLSEEG